MLHHGVTNLPWVYFETDFSAAAVLAGLCILQHQFSGLGTTEQKKRVMIFLKWT